MALRVRRASVLRRQGALMAIYTWECRTCNKRMEVERKMADYQVPPEKCEYCPSTDLFSVIVRPTNCKGVILLGETGWHDKEYTRNRSIR